MIIARLYSIRGIPVREQVKWKNLDSVVKDGKTGEVIFQQAAVEVPDQWSQNATNILAQKYLRKAGVPFVTVRVAKEQEKNVPAWLRRAVPARQNTKEDFGGETSAHQVFHRMCGAWTYWAWKEKLLTDEENAHAFYDELYMMLALQVAAPNSPQWFNTGLHWAYGIEGGDTGQWYVPSAGDDRTGALLKDAAQCKNSYERPQPHACFLTPIDDNLVNENGIMQTWATEARIFKYGSGSGINASAWRGKNEKLSGGGVASGVMSWLRIGDSAAGAIQSGGTTRRAAKMVCLDDDHPELIEFIDWKVIEESKAAAMYVGSKLISDSAGATPYAPSQVKERIKQGIEQRVFGIGWEQEANRSIDGQNSNNSIRMRDAFLKAVQHDLDWELKERTTGKVTKTIPARVVWNRLCTAAWACADPGLLFHDTINAWNTCEEDGEIKTTNPCQPADAKVLTPEGIRTFADIEEGSIIWSGKCWTRVARKVATGIKPVFAYHTLAGRFVGTAMHRVFEKGVRVAAEAAEAIDVCVGYEASAEPVDLQDVMDGLVIGDGSVHRGSGNQVYLCVGDKDGDYLETLADYMGNHRPGYAHGKGWRVKTTIVAEELVPIPERVVPARFERGDCRKVRGFLRGLFSANGSIISTNGSPSRVALKSTSFELIKQVQAMLSSIGIASRYTQTAPKRVTFANGEYECRRSYDLNIARHKQRFAKLIGFEQRYKQRLLHELAQKEEGRSKTSFEVIRVDELGEMPVWDIEVEASEHSYWTDGLLVSNCAEFHHLDGSACNLASINLARFINSEAPGGINITEYKHAIRLWTMVLDISVSMASFPSRDFAVGAYNYRTLGLGPANLGGFLMRQGIPYDSDKGRAYGAVMMSIMTGTAYATSAEMADEIGPFPRFEANRESMYRVLKKHQQAVFDYEHFFDESEVVPTEIKRAIFSSWDFSNDSARRYRNAQVTLCAPAGTISFVMDCDVTGIEPEFALVKMKYLAGGGSMMIVNQAIEDALIALDYQPEHRAKIIALIERYVPAIAAGVYSKDAKVFECANEMRPMAHVEMVAALQPHMSGAASKTINLPNSATVEDVSEVYRACHFLGVKAVSLYRDGSKLSQPLSAAKNELYEVSIAGVKSEGISAARMRELLRRPNVPVVQSVELAAHNGAVAGSSPAGHTKLNRGEREYLPWRRDRGFTQKVKIANLSAFLRVSEYPDGRPGEIFLELAHEGATLRAFANLLAMAVSVGLQHGVPVSEFVDRFTHTKFEPAGTVEGHDRIKIVSSIGDYLGRELGITYCERDDLANAKPNGASAWVTHTGPEQVMKEDGVKFADVSVTVGPAHFVERAPETVRPAEGDICWVCHNATVVWSGTCRYCNTCGANEGCG